MSNPSFVLATHNQDKVREIRQIMKHVPVELLPISQFPGTTEAIENGDTLLANAMIKAEQAFRETGLPAIADDTGLEVDFLDGAPGVYSSRFAGEDVTYDDNNNKLLELMAGVPAEKRTARFRCVVAFTNGTESFWADGVCEGIILTEKKGDQGFGYDPLFYVPLLDKTFAEADKEEKNSVSHRGIAFRNMAELLEKKLKKN